MSCAMGLTVLPTQGIGWLLRALLSTSVCVNAQRLSKEQVACHVSCFSQGNAKKPTLPHFD